MFDVTEIGVFVQACVEYVQPPLVVIDRAR